MNSTFYKTWESCPLYVCWFRTVRKPKVKTLKAQHREVSTTGVIPTWNLGLQPLVVYALYDAVSLHVGRIRTIINSIV